eukprot:CAMPEP_0201948448 /NCGR_PEP_ID=MMETSP0903-20130614/55466_1 /ASSEMBLY_ACC=CAM_ASM_000552 /TAXON_ID=420261 /ORGANISM="Thalassiosira antarctica, Strain CCMP982" /LENGTH=295 /DNA_ID=CAMNT_0048491629 /DNA_START=62 /DNA_END=949 /DNA_ORIENTATION=+
MAAPATGPAIPSTGGLPPPHSRASSAPPSAAAGNIPSSSSNNIEHIAECTYEFLLAEILQWVERDEKRIAEEAQRVHLATQELNGGNEKDTDGAIGAGGEGATTPETPTDDAAAAAVMAAERSAARIERMGYDVGYRLCERLAQHRPLLGPGSPSPESGSTDSVGVGDSGAVVGNSPIVMGGGGHHTIMDPKTQLEAVKFLCKEFWTEVFRKQIDKLQTNHRGVFVLKDQELKWLRRLPPDEENARVGAIRILAFPCGLIRGALACLGLSGAVVSCDFLADGRTMASCSFSIKVK